MQNWLRETWRRLPSRGKLAVVAVFVGAGLLFWIPPLARAVHPVHTVVGTTKPSQRVSPEQRARTWKQADHMQKTQPLLQSASPAELSRDPFSIEGFLTGQTEEPAEDHVPEPRHPIE